VDRQSTSFSDSPYPPKLMQFPKPEPRKKEKAAQKARRKAHIAKIRLQVSIRDRRCRVCGEIFGTGEQTPEMHELKSRAQLRGRPIEEIFSLENCVMLHRKCHRDVTEKRISLNP
jgi:5-methylcytosine-specific restriction endonuclease McrA